MTRSSNRGGGEVSLSDTGVLPGILGGSSVGPSTAGQRRDVEFLSHLLCSHTSEGGALFAKELALWGAICPPDFSLPFGLNVFTRVGWLSASFPGLYLGRAELLPSAAYPLWLR